MCRVKEWVGLRAALRAKSVLQPLLGEGAIFGAHVTFAGPVCGVLEKTEAVWVRLKYFWSQVKDDVL